MFALLLLSITSCEEEDNQNKTLAQTVVGVYHGQLQDWKNNITKEGYKVEVIMVSDSIVELKSYDFSNVLVKLEGDVNQGLIGYSDSLSSFGYVVKKNQIQFLYYNSSFAYSGM